MPKPDREYTRTHQRAFTRFPRAQAFGRQLTWVLSEQLNRSLGSSGPTKHLMKLAWRAQLRSQVRDPELLNAGEVLNMPDATVDPQVSRTVDAVLSPDASAEQKNDDKEDERVPGRQPKSNRPKEPGSLRGHAGDLRMT